jgi:hypothetical protein
MGQGKQLETGARLRSQLSSSPITTDDHSLHHDLEIFNDTSMLVRVRLANAYYWGDGARLSPGATAWVRVPAGDIAISAFDIDTGHALAARFWHANEDISTTVSRLILND